MWPRYYYYQLILQLPPLHSSLYITLLVLDDENDHDEDVNKTELHGNFSCIYEHVHDDGCNGMERDTVQGDHKPIYLPSLL